MKKKDCWIHWQHLCEGHDICSWTGEEDCPCTEFVDAEKREGIERDPKNIHESQADGFVNGD